ncbi:hypothetical protein GCM10022232_85760 [Streptomyces plumbiresistens]|uniref:Uncharacterized protein n=1 Tax=Streptomyces plumbiresistens TaxID=511811 RepID=A0ABP7TJ80_9ACTN
MSVFKQPRYLFSGDRGSWVPRAREGDPAGVPGCVQEVPDAAAAGHLDLPLLAGLSAVGAVRQGP